MGVRILHVVETIKSGGVENRRYTLARLLDKGVFEQKIVCTQALGQMPIKLAEAGMEVLPIGLFKSPFQFSAYIKLLRIIKAYRPHIIHGAVFEGVTLAAVAGKLGKVPVIILEETSDPQNRSGKASFFLRLLSSVAQAVVAVSPSVQSYLLQKAKISPAKVKLINNGIFFPPLPAAENVRNTKVGFGIKEGDFVVGTVGRLRDFHKRFSDLIKAIALLKQGGIANIILLIIGDGQDKAQLEALAKQLGVFEQVIFAGYQSETAVYYAMMDVFAIVSFMEAFGLVAAEAMYFKLPVITTAVGGLKDIVVHQQTGLVVNKGDTQQMAAAIKTLYNQPETRRAMGNAGYERVKSEYSAAVYVKKVGDLYKILLEH